MPRVKFWIHLIHPDALRHPHRRAELSQVIIHPSSHARAVVRLDRRPILRRSREVEVRRVSQRVHADVRPRATDALDRSARARESRERFIQRALHRRRDAALPLKAAEARAVVLQKGEVARDSGGDSLRRHHLRALRARGTLARRVGVVRAARASTSDGCALGHRGVKRESTRGTNAGRDG